MSRLATLTLALLVTLSARAGAEYPEMGPDIYDPKADGAVLIAAALKQAKAEQKNVLLEFGANWEPWGRKLEHTLAVETPLATKLSHDFVVVRLDVNMRHGVKRNDAINSRYGNPIHQGLPVLVVLDGDGKQLVTQETGALEEGDHHDPKKVMAFLAKWSPPAK
jgi:hypothetical protein